MTLCPSSFDGSCLVNRTSIEQQFFRQRRFSSIWVRDDGKVTATLNLGLQFSLNFSGHLFTRSVILENRSLPDRTSSLAVPSTGLQGQEFAG
jgi:hypothetical protein